MLLCHVFLRLWDTASAPLLDVLQPFTFLHSLDGMESSSDSSAMEEAHGDEQGSLSSSARKLFALGRRERFVVMKRFIPIAPSPSLYFLS